MKAIQKKLLLASVAVGVMTPFLGGGAVHAESVTVQPSEPSNNEVEVNEKDYTINGEKTELGEDDEYYEVYAGMYSYDNSSSNNLVTINGGTIKYNVYGGESSQGIVSDNIINFYNNSTANIVFGGYSFSSDSARNTVNIFDSNINYGVFGGRSNSGNSYENTVNITNSTTDEVLGGESSDGNSYKNVVNITGGNSVHVIGGASSKNATYNTVTINDVIVNGHVLGGMSTDSGDAINNVVTLNGGNVGNIWGGSAPIGNANYNTVTINGGTIDSIYGGDSFYGEVSNNIVTINAGTIKYDIYVGGDSSTSSDISYNVLNIYNNPTLDSAYLYGYNGYFNTSSSHSGNTLNIYTKDLTAKNIGYFDIINFYLDSNISNGDTLLTLTSTNGTDVSSTDIQAVMQSGSPLTNGDTVTLLTNASGVTAAKSYTGTAAEGVSLTYPLTVYRNDEGTAILARLGNTDTSGTDSSGTDSSGSDSSGTDSSSTDSSSTDSSSTDSSSTDSSGTDSSGSDSSSTDSSSSDSSGTDSIVSAVDDSNNTVNLYSANSGTIYGGYTDSGNASNNTVNLYSGNFEKIYGGYAPSGETSNNTLNVYNKNISAQNLSNFSAMNFYIPNDAANGDTMLTLTDSAATDLSGVSIRAGVVAGNENLAVGDTINLLQNSNALKQIQLQITAD